MNTVFILDAGRTPIGSFCGSFTTIKAHELGSVVIKELLKRQNLTPDKVSHVILGQALTAGEGQNPARQASVLSGIPYTVPGFTINQLCGSGMKSILLGCQAIKLKEAEVVVCGGQESMTQAPHCIHMRNGHKMGNSNLTDTLIYDGLTDAFNDIHMGVTAENIAEKFSISREEQDSFALKSQEKTTAAVKSGFFQKEIIPVSVKVRGGEKIISVDEYPRSDTTLQTLAKLKPVFKKDGTVTAGNASGINDGAAALILVSEEFVSQYNAKPLARIVGYAEGGVDPKVMGLGPIPAVKSLLEKISWSNDEVDLYEINEAFASQSIAVLKELQINENKVNVNGGAIALGHPIGASGARIVVTLIYNLLRTNGKRGIASLCIGGGMGIAIAVEMI